MFDPKQDRKILWQTALHSAHGLVWDAERKKLYALGFKELRTYSLKDWETDSPSLVQDSTLELPDEDGHDFRPVPNSPDIVFTTDKSVWLFDREKFAIRPHPELKDRPLIKCVDIHPTTGRVLFNQASEGKWWSDTLQFLNPSMEFKLAGEHLYKARWMK